MSAIPAQEIVDEFIEIMNTHPNLPNLYRKQMTGKGLALLRYLDTIDATNNAAHGNGQHVEQPANPFED